MLKPIVASVLASAILVAGPVAAKTYTCDVKDQANAGVIPEIVVIVHEDVGNKAAVLDPIIQHYYEAPLTATVAAKNKKRATFTWTLEDITLDGPGRVFLSKLAYRATIKTADNSIIVTARPLGYRNHFRGTGTCKVEE